MTGILRDGSRLITERPKEPDAQVEQTFDRLVDEGGGRLGRSWKTLLVTGFVGGVDVGTGVLAYLLVKAQTGSTLLAGLAFAVGFVALTLARSELFTENFLVPVAAVVAGRGRWRDLVRLWLVTLVANLAGGWLVTWLVVVAFPGLRGTVVEAGTHYAHLGTGGRSFALAVLAGMVITLMTRMQHATESLGCGSSRRCCSARCSPGVSSSTRCSTRCSPSRRCTPGMRRSGTPTGRACWVGPCSATSSAGWDW